MYISFEVPVPVWITRWHMPNLVNWFYTEKIFAKPLLQLRSTRKVKTLLCNLLIICLFNSLFSINGFKTDMKTRMSKTRKSFYYLNAAGEKNL